MSINWTNAEFKEKIEVARKTLKFSCRFHPTEGWHQVGCPHQKWTLEQLQSALEAEMALVRFYQHSFLGMSIDGEPQFVTKTPDETPSANS